MYDTVKKIMEELNIISPFDDVISVPQECEIAVRKNDQEKYYFILNYTNESQKVSLKKELKNMYTSEYMTGSITMAPYDTLILLL